MMKQEADLNSEKQIYLTCEKYYIFELLIFAAGMMGRIPSICAAVCSAMHRLPMSYLWRWRLERAK